MNSPLASAAPTPFPRTTQRIRDSAESGRDVEIFDPRHRFVVGTPIYDACPTEYYRASMRRCETEGPSVRYRRPDGSAALDTVIAGGLHCYFDSHVDRARNTIANQFMAQTAADWLLWIDSDIEWHPSHIARLFQHAMNGHKFVAGLYAMKCLKPTFVANVRQGAKIDPTTGLIEVADAGTGFLLLHRDVFTALQSHPHVQRFTTAPNSPYPGKVWHAYFSSGPYGEPDPKTGAPQWLSEDWMLCRLWQELGGKVFADTEIKLRHFGSLLYPPSIAELEDAVCDLLSHNNPGLDHARLKKAVDGYKAPPPPTPFPQAATLKQAA